MGILDWPRHQLENCLVMWPKDWNLTQRHTFSEVYNALAKGAKEDPAGSEASKRLMKNLDKYSQKGAGAMKFGFSALQQYGVENGVVSWVRSYHDIFKETPPDQCLQEIRDQSRESRSLPIQGMNREQVFFMICLLEARVYGSQSSQRWR